MSNQISCGTFRQRVGLLIEQYIIDKFVLHANKRQRTQGYYDAYDDRMLYEIKASSVVNNRFTLKVDNHKKLYDKSGEYIFVSYDIKDTDKDLKMMSDIIIKNIYQVSANDLHETLISFSKESTVNKSNNSRPNKNMYRVALKYIKSCEGVKNHLM